MEIINYDTLLEKHAGIAFERQYSLAEIIGENDWNLDMNTGMMRFGSCIEMQMQIIGTYSLSSETWLWAWANEASNIPENLLIEANKLKALGEKYNIEFLTMDEYKIESTDVHALGMIASGEFDSSAYYAANFGEGIILVTLKSPLIDEVEYNETARILECFPQIISIFGVNHKRTLQNYLRLKGFTVFEEEEITAQKGKNIIRASFDENNRLAKINGELSTQ